MIALFPLVALGGLQKLVKPIKFVNSDQITLIEQSTTPIEQSPMKAISLLE